MADFCSICGADKYICQVCGKDFCADEKPPKWSRFGNVCPSCSKAGENCLHREREIISYYRRKGGLR